VADGRDQYDDCAVREVWGTGRGSLEDDLWVLIEPLLPPWPERAPGPKPADDRLRLQGILYVLYNDVSWQLLPWELGFGSGRPAGAG
jgi:transposase